METTGNLDPLSGRGTTSPNFGGDNVYSFLWKVSVRFMEIPGPDLEFFSRGFFGEKHGFGCQDTSPFCWCTAYRGISTIGCPLIKRGIGFKVTIASQDSLA